MNRFLTIEELNRLLNQWNGSTIKVSKHEMGDLDELLLNLDHISYASNKNRLDNYTAAYTLQLNGAGNVMTDMNNMQALPASVYEIPLEDSALYEYDGQQFLISTERGVYKIRRFTQ